MKFCPLCGKQYDQGESCPADGAVLVLEKERTDPFIGRVLKETYRIEELIGAGGMGDVFRAVQLPLGRDVAVKILSSSTDSSGTVISRFFQEARLLSQLSHPNVVSIIDFGNTEDGTIFMVMEYLRGKTFGDAVPAGAGLPMSEALHWMRQTCSGVGAAHRCGLVHRDLKPENLFIASNRGAPDVLKILDFGIARTVEDAEETRLTQMGFLVGTPGFIAPEQIESPSDADARSDVYALGAILYFAVTGNRPYEGKTPHSILIQQMQEPPALDLGLLAAEGRLAATIGKAMSIDPKDRFASTDELVEALDAAEGRGGVGTLGQQIATQSTAEGRTPDPTRLAPISSSSSSASSSASALAPKSKRLSARVAVASMAALLVLAGGFWWLTRDGGNAFSTLENANLETRGVTATEIAVGMSAAFSGPSRELGRSMQTGIETSFQEINQAGGIHGRMLSLTALDDAYEPDRAVTNMVDLVLERKVFAVLGNVGTPTTAVSVPLALEQRVPFVGALSGAELLRRSPPDRYVFNYRTSYAEETAAIIQNFLDRRLIQPAEIVVFAQDDGFGDAGYDGVVSALENRGYSADTLRVGYRRNSTDIQDAVDRVIGRRTETKGVVLVATYRAAAKFIKALSDAGVKPVFANLSFVGSRALAEELGPSYSEGVVVTQVVPHFDSQLPGVARYRESLARHFPAEQAGFLSLEGYLVAEVFAEALRRAGSQLTVEGFVDSMESMSQFDLGIGAELSFGPERHQALSKVWASVLDKNGRYLELDL